MCHFPSLVRFNRRFFRSVSTVLSKERSPGGNQGDVGLPALTIGGVCCYTSRIQQPEEREGNQHMPHLKETQL